MSARYEVCSIEGWAVNSGSTGPTTTYWVADRLYGCREVFMLPPIPRVDPGKRRRRVEDRCAELNAEHDAWMRDNGYVCA